MYDTINIFFQAVQKYKSPGFRMPKNLGLYTAEIQFNPTCSNIKNYDKYTTDMPLRCFLRVATDSPISTHHFVGLLSQLRQLRQY